MLVCLLKLIKTSVYGERWEKQIFAQTFQSSGEYTRLLITVLRSRRGAASGHAPAVPGAVKTQRKIRSKSELMFFIIMRAFKTDLLPLCRAGFSFFPDSSHNLLTCRPAALGRKAFSRGSYL